MKNIHYSAYSFLLVFLFSCASQGVYKPVSPEESANNKIIGSLQYTLDAEKAIASSAETLITQLPENSILAVLEIFSNNPEESLLMRDELEYQLVWSGKFKIVARKDLDQIKTEQHFQMSGNVDDNSAVSIGKLLGAHIVIAGNVTDSGTSRLLTIRALDVTTAQIVAMVRERY